MSVVQCELTSGITRKTFVRCLNPADFAGHATPLRRSPWNLCRYHKEAVFNYYNEATRIKEMPLWKPIIQ